jgi:hypothetical protein
VYNICILSAAENYAYFDLNNYYDFTKQEILNTYNCFTKLKEAVENGNVLTPGGIDYYTYRIFDGVIANLHAYAGFFNVSGGESQKNPGYGNPSEVTQYTNTLAIADYLLGLTQGKRRNGTDISLFKISIPIIFTEFGQYNLPWGNYSTNPSTIASDYSISNKPYPGFYWNKDLVQIIGPALVGMCENFKDFNVSYTIWACRPNGKWDSESYEYWNPNQPDTMINNFYNVPIRLINQNDFPQPNLSNCYYNDCPSDGISDVPTASGYQEGGTGADFQYLFDTYFKGQNN